MTKILFTLILLISFCSFGQKHTRYYDEKNSEISKKDFENLSDNFYFKKTTYNTNSTTKTAYLRRSSGQLTIKEKSNFLLELENSLNIKLDSTKTLIIHHYRKTCQSINNETSDLKYIKICKKYPQTISYFVSEKGFNPNNKKVFEDTQDVIARYFISENYDDTNYVIIKPDGTFYVVFGKYNLIGVLDLAV